MRSRSVIHLLSIGLFNKSIPLYDFPEDPNIYGLGLSDWNGYATRLKRRLINYTNTFYHKEPKLDITDVKPELHGNFDFLISTEVFEHIPPPVSRAFCEARKLLKDTGVMVFTVPYIIRSLETIEHFPLLYDWNIKTIGDKKTLINRRRDGINEVFDNPVFHGGEGDTLEMRVFALTSIIKELQFAGFTSAEIFFNSYLKWGIVWDKPWSLPILVRA